MSTKSFMRDMGDSSSRKSVCARYQSPNTICWHEWEQASVSVWRGALVNDETYRVWDMPVGFESGAQWYCDWSSSLRFFCLCYLILPAGLTMSKEMDVEAMIEATHLLARCAAP